MIVYTSSISEATGVAAVAEVIMTDMPTLSCVAGACTLRYTTAPHVALRRAVVEKLYENLFPRAVAAAELDESELMNKRCEASDGSGNSMPVPLSDVWKSIQDYFDEEVMQPWMVYEGCIALQAHGAAEAKATATAKKSRKAADDLQKVRLPPPCPDEDRTCGGSTSLPRTCLPNVNMEPGPVLPWVAPNAVQDIQAGLHFMFEYLPLRGELAEFLAPLQQICEDPAVSETIDNYMQYLTFSKVKFVNVSDINTFARVLQVCHRRRGVSPGCLLTIQSRACVAVWLIRVHAPLCLPAV